MVSQALSGLFRYGESELEPSIQAEILLESSRNEARVATLEIVVAMGFWLWYGPSDPAFHAVAIFCLITVLPLLVDSQLRRSAAKRVLGHGPKQGRLARR